MKIDLFQVIIRKCRQFWVGENVFINSSAWRILHLLRLWAVGDGFVDNDLFNDLFFYDSLFGDGNLSHTTLGRILLWSIRMNRNGGWEWTRKYSCLLKRRNWTRMNMNDNRIARITMSAESFIRICDERSQRESKKRMKKGKVIKFMKNQKTGIKNEWMCDIRGNIESKVEFFLIFMNMFWWWK